jgi:hypothetical protein
MHIEVLYSMKNKNKILRETKFNKILKGNLFIMTIFIIIQSSCVNQKKDIVHILSRDISYNDIEIVAKLNNIQPGMDTTITAVLYQLCFSNACLAVADSLRIPVTKSILSSEAKRISLNTHMPQRIDSIYNTCSDSATYIRLFVMPQFVQRWLLYNFTWNSAIHKKQGDSAKLLIEELKTKPRPLKEFSKKHSYQFCKYTVDMEKGISPINSKPDNKYSQAGFRDNQVPVPENISELTLNAMDTKSEMITKQLIEKVLSRMKGGTIYPYPVEMENSFWILQLYELFNGKYYIGVLEIPKIEFCMWLNNQIQKIPISITDTGLWHQMQEKIPLSTTLFQSAVIPKNLISKSNEN